MVNSKNKIKEKLSGIYLMLCFIFGNSGQLYKISKIKKIILCFKILRINKKANALSSWWQHIMMVDEILRISPDTCGDVVECGCYNGASSSSLSLACKLTNRKLFVCDSFEGLPEPKEEEKYEINGKTDNYYIWEKGEFSCNLNNVKRNIEKYGDISCCEFVVGYFNKSLPNIDTNEIVLIFEDADLASSVEDCVINLWPKLKYDCKFVSHEPWSIKVVSIFYNDNWWKENLKQPAPGFHGSGRGVSFGIQQANIGYSVKFDYDTIKQTGSKVIHSGSNG